MDQAHPRGMRSTSGDQAHPWGMRSTSGDQAHPRGLLIKSTPWDQAHPSGVLSRPQGIRHTLGYEVDLRGSGTPKGCIKSTPGASDRSWLY